MCKIKESIKVPIKWTIFVNSFTLTEDPVNICQNFLGEIHAWRRYVLMMLEKDMQQMNPTV